MQRRPLPCHLSFCGPDGNAKRELIERAAKIIQSADPRGGNLAHAGYLQANTIVTPYFLNPTLSWKSRRFWTKSIVE